MSIFPRTVAAIGRYFLLPALVVSLGSTVLGQTPEPAAAPAPAPDSTPHPAALARPPKEPPTFADVAYGPDAKQKLDIYVPPGSGPFPVVFWIHGGGWTVGDKRTGAIEPAPYLNHGCAVVSIDYRLIPDAVYQNISPPIVAVLGDTRRALQYVRLHAADWHLDPNKILVAGSSAGAASALYLGCEGEQANPNATDPVERVSTKVLGIGAGIAQTSVDPKRIREWVPGVHWGVQAFEPHAKPRYSDADFEKFLSDRPKWLPYIMKYSPDWLLSKDTPPIYFFYGQGLPDPAGPPPTSPELVHSPLWAIGFQKLAQSQGVECYLQYKGHPAEKYRGLLPFVLHQLGLSGT